MTKIPDKINAWTSDEFGPQWVSFKLKLPSKLPYKEYILNTPETLRKAGWVRADPMIEIQHMGQEYDATAEEAVTIPPNPRARVVTEYISPPIPDCSHDWYARFDFHNGDTDLRGFGETEESAIIDLIQNAMDYDGDGSEQEVVQDLAIYALTTRPAAEIRNAALEEAANAAMKEDERRINPDPSHILPRS